MKHFDTRFLRRPICCFQRHSKVSGFRSLTPYSHTPFFLASKFTREIHLMRPLPAMLQVEMVVFNTLLAVTHMETTTNKPVGGWVGICLISQLPQFPHPLNSKKEGEKGLLESSPTKKKMQLAYTIIYFLALLSDLVEGVQSYSRVQHGTERKDQARGKAGGVGGMRLED